MSTGHRAASLLFMSIAIAVVSVLASAATSANNTGAAASGAAPRSIIIKVADPDPPKPAPPPYKEDISVIAARWDRIERLEESLPDLEKKLADAVAAARTEKTWNPAAGVAPKRPARPVNQNGVDPVACDRYTAELDNYVAALRRQTSIIKGGHYARPGARTYRTAAELIRGVTVQVGGRDRVEQRKLRQEIAELSLAGECRVESDRLVLENLKSKPEKVSGRDVTIRVNGSVHLLPDELLDVQRRLHHHRLTVKLTGVIDEVHPGGHDMLVSFSDIRIEVLAIEETDRSRTDDVKTPALGDGAEARKPYDGRNLESLSPQEQVTALMTEQTRLNKEIEGLVQMIRVNAKEAARLTKDRSLLEVPKHPGYGPQGGINTNHIPAMKQNIADLTAYRNGLQIQATKLRDLINKSYETPKKK